MFSDDFPPMPRSCVSPSRVGLIVVVVVVVSVVHFHEEVVHDSSDDAPDVRDHPRDPEERSGFGERVRLLRLEASDECQKASEKKLRLSCHINLANIVCQI